MASNIVSLFDLAFASVSGWFIQIMDSTGMRAFYLVMFFILLVCAYLLAPLFFNLTYGGISDVSADMRAPYTKKHKGDD